MIKCPFIVIGPYTATNGEVSDPFTVIGPESTDGSGESPLIGPESMGDGVETPFISIAPSKATNGETSGLFTVIDSRKRMNETGGFAVAMDASEEKEERRWEI